jgi:hypothetical protein
MSDRAGTRKQALAVLVVGVAVIFGRFVFGPLRVCSHRPQSLLEG